MTMPTQMPVPPSPRGDSRSSSAHPIAVVDRNVSRSALRKTGRAAIILGGAIAALTMAGITNPARASAQQAACLTFTMDTPGPSVWTWGDYDLWVLEAGGETFEFANPDDGVLLTAGNGSDIEVIYKCSPSPDPAPTPTPTLSAMPTPAPPATPTPAPNAPLTPTATATAVPTPRPTAPVTPRPTDRPTPRPTVPSQVLPSPTETPSPRAVPPTGGDDSSTFGLSPDPEEPNSEFILPPGSDLTSGAEVRSLQLARTGPGRVALLTTIAASLSAVGLGLVAAGRRRGANIS